MNMKLKAFFENIVSFFRNINTADLSDKFDRGLEKARISVLRLIHYCRKFANATLRFFFAEETISDIKKARAFLIKISKIVARIAAIPCFFIGLFMILEGIYTSLTSVILGFFIMAIPKAILESGKVKKVVYAKFVKTEEFDSSKTPAFASIDDTENSEK